MPDATPPSPGRPGLRPLLRWLPAGLAVLALAVLPWLLPSPWLLHLGVVLFLAVAQGSSWNLLGGLAGQRSAGHAAYFGVGAYAAVVLAERWHVAPWWGLPAAAAAAVVAGLVIGGLTFRLRGPAFVLGSLAVAELLRQAALHLPSLTGGAQGLAVTSAPALRLLGLELPLSGKRPFYYLSLALALLAVLIVRAVRRARLGHLLLAIGQDPDAAAGLGIRLAVNKHAALALSAALAGAAGAAHAGFARSIDPAAAFGLEVSVGMALVALLGGAGTVEGPIIGAALLVPLGELLRDPAALARAGLLAPDSGLVAFLGRWPGPAQLVLQGLVLVLVLLFLPEGVSGLVRRRRARRQRLEAAPPAAAPAA